MEAERACFHVRKTVVPKTTTKKILIEFLTLLVSEGVKKGVKSCIESNKY